MALGDEDRVRAEAEKVLVHLLLESSTGPILTTVVLLARLDRKLLLLQRKLSSRL